MSRIIKLSEVRAARNQNRQHVTWLLTGLTVVIAGLVILSRVIG